MSVDRGRVESSFSRWASEYDAHTPVQQRVVDRLMDTLNTCICGSPEKLLDIGCGTGRLLDALSRNFPDTSLYGLDISAGMLAKAVELLGERAVLIRGDAEELPFPSGFFDLVISASTFQWLDSCDKCFRSVHNVMQPGGQFVFSLFGSGTLAELQCSWREALARCGHPLSAGTHDGTHRFQTAGDILASLERCGFTDCSVDTCKEIVWYPDLPGLLHAIKRVGAGSSRPPSGGGLGWRRVMHEMAVVYAERYGSSGELPATYQVIFGRGTV